MGKHCPRRYNTFFYYFSLFYGIFIMLDSKGICKEPIACITEARRCIIEILCADSGGSLDIRFDHKIILPIAATSAGLHNTC